MAPVICVPTKELKNTQNFTATVQGAEGPVIVTKNGKDAFVSMSLDCYDAMMREGARARLYESIDRAEADIADGRLVDAHAKSFELRARYGL